MGRFTDMDEDAERLPEGMQRIGYDADTQRYTFRDADGSLYESAPGSRYGELRPVRSHDVDSAPASPENDETRVGRYKGPAYTFEEIEARNKAVDQGNREAVRTMLPFALLVLVVLFLVFRFWTVVKAVVKFKLNGETAVGRLPTNKAWV